MESSSKSMGGEGALLLFGVGGTELSGGFETCRRAGGSDEDKFCEELELD